MLLLCYVMLCYIMSLLLLCYVMLLSEGTGSTASPAVSGVGSTTGVTNPGITLRS